MEWQDVCISVSTETTAPAKLAALLDMERAQGLFDFRVDGWSAWRVLRHPVHTIVGDLPLKNAGPPDFVRALRALRHTFTLLRLLLFARRRDALVKTYRSALRAQRGDRYCDVYFDSYIMRRPSCLKLEVVNSDRFEEQARKALRPPDLDSAVFTFWGRILAVALPRLEAASFCRRVALMLKQELDVAVSAAYLLRQISSTYWQSRLYALLLSRVRPKLVMVADTGDYGLLVACARRGIRFIELQHGVFDALHGDAVPDWVRGSSSELLLPDVLACYGPFWIEQLSPTRLAAPRAVAVGNDLIDTARQLPREAGAPGHVRILVTSQGLDSARLARWLADMLEAAPVDVMATLTIKLHPSYDDRSNEFAQLGATANVRIVPGSASPNLWELLASTDLHLSISSASHFDAAALGIPSVVVPLAGHERVLHAVDGDFIYLASGPGEIWKIARRPPRTDTQLREHYVVTGFVQNLLDLIDHRARSLEACPKAA